MTLRGMLWRLHLPLTLPLFLRRAKSGRPWRVPWRIWTHLSPNLWWSIRSQMIEPGEEVARDVLRTNHPLAAVITQEDLANNWAASPMTLLVLWDRLNCVRPESIVEMGSG